MTFWRWMTFAVLGLSLSSGPGVAGELPGERSRYLADYANGRYAHAAIETLRELVAFRTVNPEGVRPASPSGFRALTDYFRNKAKDFGFDFEDYGVAVVLGLGESRDRLGLLAHADVQPADPAKWSKDPFILDTESEPGKLIGRGVEDDKGPISAALYAMKTLADFDVELKRRIELIIVYTEESDWNAIRQVLDSYDPPELNVSLDGAYPVVVAEKGWGEIYVSFPPDDGPLQADVPTIASFTGGVFLSQIPENSEVTIVHAPPKLERKLRQTARRHSEIDFTFSRQGEELVIRARGLAAHSAAPEKGFNSLTHLAALIGEPAWSDTREARMVRLINDLVGTGDLAGRFGDLAYSEPFMGPLTLTLARLRLEEDDLVAGLSFRWPIGRSKEEIRRVISVALEAWKEETGFENMRFEVKRLEAPHYMRDAPHVPILLSIYEHYTGQKDPQPLSMGGGTIARLFPKAVNFGPSMPGVIYTGHTEHEFITRDQFLLNLKMYTAMLTELTVDKE